MGYCATKVNCGIFNTVLLCSRFGLKPTVWSWGSNAKGRNGNGKDDDSSCVEPSLVFGSNLVSLLLQTVLDSSEGVVDLSSLSVSTIILSSIQYYSLIFEQMVNCGVGERMKVEN